MEQRVIIYTVDTFNWFLVDEIEVQKRKRGNPGRKNKIEYVDCFSAFDIETTNIKEIEQSIMYVWQFQLGDYTIMGRTWAEFIKLVKQLKLHLKGRLIVYCHNLAFEFSFLKSVLDFASDDVFCVKVRKVLRALYDECLEFRCSYILTGLSLADFTARMGVKAKLSGDEYDYSKERYPWTTLTDRELEYCVTDVKSLVAALKVFFEIEHDNFYSIPLTATGFVRRDMKKAMKKYNKAKLKVMLPDEHVYSLLKEAFRGGNTHANRYYSNMIIGNVKSIDRVSSYPDVQINDLFPMTPFIREENITLDRAMRIIYKQERAVLFHIAFFDIELDDPLWGCPYIAKHKCTTLSRKHYNDNGRILAADYLEITVTDIDFKIIMDEYKFSAARIDEFYHAGYGRLPKCFRDEVIKFFKIKTDLKNVEGEELFYHKAKEKLNSIYGMSVQDLAKQKIVYDRGNEKGDFYLADTPMQKLVEDASKKSFVAYQWGVWTTAHARARLEEMIKAVGVDNFIYCDTDSVKYIDTGECVEKEINKQRKKQSKTNGGYASDRDGNIHYLGLWENDGNYDRFITIGAKKYAYEQNGKIGITIAGVQKTKGAIELDEAGGLEAFKSGFVFRVAGGVKAVYNDNPEGEYIINGCCFNSDSRGERSITSNCYLGDSEYTLGLRPEYERLLSDPTIWRDSDIL